MRVMEKHHLGSEDSDAQISTEDTGGDAGLKEEGEWTTFNLREVKPESIAEHPVGCARRVRIKFWSRGPNVRL